MTCSVIKVTRLASVLDAFDGCVAKFQWRELTQQGTPPGQRPVVPRLYQQGKMYAEIQLLIIRREQIQVFERLRREQFSARLERHLCRMLQEAGAVVQADELRRQITTGLSSALRFFENEADIARYAEIVLLHLGGWKADDHPTIALQMLHARSVAAGSRLANFERWAKLNGSGIHGE